MKKDHFVRYVKHFIADDKPSKESPKVLLLDNHDSHLSRATLEYYKQNGVTVLSFSPNCKHKLHPLDVAVHRPL
jgi:ribosome biogenesis protein Tsr3